MNKFLYLGQGLKLKHFLSKPIYKYLLYGIMAFFHLETIIVVNNQKNLRGITVGLYEQHQIFRGLQCQIIGYVLWQLIMLHFE